MYAAIKTILAASSGLTALLAVKPIGTGPAIYDDGSVPQAATFAYLTIGAGTQTPDHAMGEDGLARFGWNCTLQVKAVGQGSEASGLAIMSEVAKALKPGTALTLAGYTRAWVEDFVLFPTLVSTEAGIVTRQWPAILRAIASDT